MLQADDHSSFISMYGRDLFDYVNDVVDRSAYVEAAALAVYFVEMCEEVMFSHTKFKLIGTKLYGLTHNREQNSLDMNYLVLQEVAGRSELTFENILYHVDRFLPRTEKGLRHDMIKCLPPFIKATRQVVVKAIERGHTGQLTTDQLRVYIRAHNQAVAGHLASRENDPSIPIEQYRTLEDVQESKEHLVFQELSDSQARVLAAFVFLDATNDAYTQEDVSRLSGLAPSQVSAITQWLLEHAFIERDPRQRYYSTNVIYDGITLDEARNLVHVIPVVDEKIENLSWLQGLIFATLQELAGDDEVQIGGDELVSIATRGRWSTSNGSTSEAIDGLVGRNLISKDTSTKPYTYQVENTYDPRFILSNVQPDDQPEIQEVLQRDSQGVEFEEVESTGNVIEGGLVEMTVTREPIPMPQAESSEAATQREATQNLEGMLDDLIQNRLRMMSPSLARRVLNDGRVNVEYDESEGNKTTISFTWSEASAEDKTW